MFRQLVLNVSLLLTIACAVANDFPAPIIKCHVDDEPCIIQQTNTFFRNFAKGIPERGIPSLEPFKVDKIEILGDKNSPARMDLILTDVEFHNYSKIDIKSAKISAKKLSADKPVKVTIKGYFEELTVKAKYKADGRVLVLPIKGDGDLVWRLKGLKGKTTAVLKPETHDDGKIYLTVIDYKIETKLKNFNAQMTNLFNGDETLSENILNLINQNWQLLVDDTMIAVNAAMAKEQAVSLNTFLKDIPFENYFLPDENSS